MIGEIKFIGKEMYMQTNKQGTLQKLDPVAWYYQIWLYLISKVKGEVHIDTVKKYIKKSSSRTYIANRKRQFKYNRRNK